METKNPATPAPTQNKAAENPALNEAIRRYVRAYALGTAGPRQPSDSAYHAIPCGASWNGDTWAAPCRAPSPAP